jgi:hypothetical protein
VGEADESHALLEVAIRVYLSDRTAHALEEPHVALDAAAIRERAFQQGAWSGLGVRASGELQALKVELKRRGESSAGSPDRA